MNPATDNNTQRNRAHTTNVLKQSLVGQAWDEVPLDNLVIPFKQNSQSFLNPQFRVCLVVKGGRGAGSLGHTLVHPRLLKPIGQRPLGRQRPKGPKQKIKQTRKDPRRKRRVKGMRWSCGEGVDMAAPSHLSSHHSHSCFHCGVCQESQSKG